MPEMGANLIPDRIEAVTAEWLTAALGAESVESVEFEIIGAGQGFLGIVARLTISHEGCRDAAKSTLIAKFPTRVDDNRTMGELMGIYWREIHFYEELAARVPLRTPGHRYSAMTSDPMRFRQYQIVKVLDRMPAFFVDRLTRFAKREMRKSAHRYVLLIEDLGNARVGDQVSGGSAEACGQVLDAVAKMHAHFWGGKELAPLPWLQDQNVNPRMRHRMYLESRSAFEKQYALHMSNGAARMLEWIDAHGVKLARVLHRDAPETLIHSDLRFDNVFFDHERPDSPVILADWQLVGRGAAAYDVAYLLSGALAADAAADVERALLERYHAALLAGGVGGYGFERFLRDYQRSLPAVFQILATTESMDLGHERGAELMSLWVERALARLRGVDLDRLL
jgi:hypothetical protein